MIGLLQTRIGMAVAGGALVFLLGSGAWIWILYDQIDTLDGKVSDLEREAGQLESDLEVLESDNETLATSLRRQTKAVEAMRIKMLGERERADAAAEELANQPVPAAADGADAMLAWWNDNVVR